MSLRVRLISLQHMSMSQRPRLITPQHLPMSRGLKARSGLMIAAAASLSHGRCFRRVQHRNASTAAVDFRASLGSGSTRRERIGATYHALHERGAALVRQLWDGLSAIRGVTIYGPQPDAPRTPTIAFTIAGIPSRQVAAQLADHAVFVSNGDFYATTVVDRLGEAKDGMVRAGCACYTTSDEVARLIAGVREIAGR
jgi:selenocysteine lyase/cysteine desulfurase